MCLFFLLIFFLRNRLAWLIKICCTYLFRFQAAINVANIPRDKYVLWMCFSERVLTDSALKLKSKKIGYQWPKIKINIVDDLANTSLSDNNFEVSCKCFSKIIFNHCFATNLDINSLFAAHQTERIQKRRGKLGLHNADAGWVSSRIF